MTEAEWLACTDPTPMLEFLRRKASDRKVRLWGCACCRRIWHILSGAGRAAVEAAERWAAGRISGGMLNRIGRQSYQEIGPHSADPRDRGRRCAALAVWHATAETAYQVTHTAGRPRPVGAWGYAVEAVLASAPRSDPSVAAGEYETQCALLRDVVGDPSRPVTVGPAWLTWNAGVAPKLAQAAYDDRLLPSGELDPARLAVLADALEEAGCTDADILGHLRGPGPHVRGCHVLDLLLGKS